MPLNATNRCTPTVSPGIILCYSITATHYILAAGMIDFNDQYGVIYIDIK